MDRVNESVLSSSVGEHVIGQVHERSYLHLCCDKIPLIMSSVSIISGFDEVVLALCEVD